MMRGTAAAVVAMAIGCGGHAVPATPKPTVGDLWSFAPPGTDFALVVADGGLAASVREARTYLEHWQAADPDGAARVRARAGVQLVLAALLDDAEIARYGMDLRRGAAMFRAGTVYVLILPVADRDVFRVRASARVAAYESYEVDHLGETMCADIRGRYVCATDPALLPAFDKSPAPMPAWPAELPGQIQVYAGAEMAAKLPKEDAFPMRSVTGLRMGVDVAPGRIALRMIFAGTPGQTAPAPWPALDDILARDPAGIALVRMRHLVEARLARTENMSPMTRAALASWTGDGAAYAWAGEPSGGGVRLRFDTPAKALLAISMCETSAPAVTLHRIGDRCQGTLGLPGWPRLDIVARTEDRDVVITIGDPRGGTAPPAPGGGARTASAGLILDAGARGVIPVAIAPFLPADVATAEDGPTRTALWIASHIVEARVTAHVAGDGYRIAMRVRTTFDNPADVVAELEPLLARAMRRDLTAVDAIRALAARRPDTPLARDVAAGSAGILALAGLFALWHLAN